MNSDGNVIEIKSVYKCFKDNVVLKDINLHLESGHIYGIVGHNGSGKTVLFKCICGFLKTEKGSILINGKKMGKEMNMLTNAGIIIEEPGFLRNWSAYRNLSFLYTIRNFEEKNVEKLKEYL